MYDWKAFKLFLFIMGLNGLSNQGNKGAEDKCKVQRYMYIQDCKYNGDGRTLSKSPINNNK